MSKMFGMLRAMNNFATGEIHERCPKCGALNGPFERLGSGICNECLRRRVAATKAANKRRAKREANKRRDS